MSAGNGAAPEIEYQIVLQLQDPAGASYCDRLVELAASGEAALDAVLARWPELREGWRITAAYVGPLAGVEFYGVRRIRRPAFERDELRPAMQATRRHL